MVSLEEIRSSNARIATALPPGLVAVFVGGTSGVGETTMKQFAKHAVKPRIYFIGRSESAAERIQGECKALNPEGEYNFIKADASLVQNVDKATKEIKSRETTINLLFLSIGTFAQHDTSEDLPVSTVLSYYSRTRFIVNLLPLLQKASSLRRVINVFAGAKEGPVISTDFPARKVSMSAMRGHASSLITLTHEALAKKAPEVSFIQDFPGAVKSGLAREAKGVLLNSFLLIYGVLGPLFYMDTDECGERHLFFATSARFAPAADKEAASGVPLEADGVSVAKGTNGEIGSGTYSIDPKAEPAGPDVEKVLAKMRQEGVIEKLWEHTEKEFVRITGLPVA